MLIPISTPPTAQPGQRVSGRRLPNRNRPGDEDRERKNAMVETTRDEGRKASFGHDSGSSWHPGSPGVSAIAGHWAVHDDTARGLLAAGGTTPAMEAGVDLYAWDVWRIEGAGYVPPSRFDDYRAPMVEVEALGRGNARDRARGLRRLGLVDLGPSALRDRVKGIAAPVVRLGPRISRVRPCDLPALLQLLAAPRKVRRWPALSRRPAPDRGG